MLRPIQAATSPIAIKAYLSTLLFFIASSVLLGASTLAYLFLYYNYIPQIDLSHVIYLQYGSGSPPYAITQLDHSALVSQQPYDVFINLHLPRTTTNLAAGNFMVDLSLLTASNSAVKPDSAESRTPIPLLDAYSPLFTSRRPAILPYTSPILSLTNTFVNLPWHLLSFRDLDSSQLQIPMFEHVSFARGSPSQNIPCAIRLEIQSDIVLQIYSANIEFKARFEGLRYILYNYRVLCYILFSSIFYTVSITSMTTAWLLVTTTLSSSSTKTEEPQRRIKSEPNHSNGTAVGPASSNKDEASATMKRSPSSPSSTSPSDSDTDHGLSLSNLSDTPATFPTLGRQMPLRMPVRRKTPPPPPPPAPMPDLPPLPAITADTPETVAAAIRHSARRRSEEAAARMRGGHGDDVHDPAADDQDTHPIDQDPAANTSQQDIFADDEDEDADGRVLDEDDDNRRIKTEEGFDSGIGTTGME